MSQLSRMEIMRRLEALNRKLGEQEAVGELYLVGGARRGTFWRTCLPPTVTGNTADRLLGLRFDRAPEIRCPEGWELTMTPEIGRSDVSQTLAEVSIASAPEHGLGALRALKETSQQLYFFS